jgi:hypothetical protein
LIRHAVLGLFAALIGSASLADAQENKSYAAPAVMTFESQRSCARWLSNDYEEEQGEHWIFGLWTGLNMKNHDGGLVGQTTDGEAIIGEIKLICQKEPSLSLLNAAWRVYGRFEKERK